MIRVNKLVVSRPHYAFKPETWPVDADGDAPTLCTECGTPVRYGSRHTFHE